HHFTAACNGHLLPGIQPRQNLGEFGAQLADGGGLFHVKHFVSHEISVKRHKLTQSISTRRSLRTQWAGSATYRRLSSVHVPARSANLLSKPIDKMPRHLGKPQRL